MEDRENVIRIVQLTDCHLLADPSSQLKGWNTFDLLQDTVAHLAQHHADSDLLLLTGDLSQDESPHSYQHLQQSISSLSIPTYALAGNHDNMNAMRSIFNGDSISCDKVILAGNWQILLVNSAREGETAGTIATSELRWLESQLQKNSHRPTLIALHHPPLEVGSAWIDALGLNNADDLFDIIDQQPQIKLVLFGHIHQAFNAVRNGVHYLGTPSTCFQFKPGCDEFALDDSAQGYRWLELFPDGSFNTDIEHLLTCTNTQ